MYFPLSSPVKCYVMMDAISGAHCVRQALVHTPVPYPPRLASGVPRARVRALLRQPPHVEERMGLVCVLPTARDASQSTSSLADTSRARQAIAISQASHRYKRARRVTA